MNTVDELVM